MASPSDSSRSARGNDVPSYPGMAFAVTPSDAADQNYAFQVYVGGTGNVSVIPADSPDGTPVVFMGVPAGSMVPCMVRRVRVTGTTATNMTGVY